ncbi:MAG: sodium:calcium antiporter [Candidatus Entotheonellia bacterium]
MLQPHMLLGVVLLGAGIALVLWGAERFTDGAIGTALRLSMSPFYVGALVSGFEPENLVTGGAAALGGLPQVALGTVIGAAIFMLTAGLGVALLLVPMEVNIPRAGGGGMLLCLVPFALTLWSGGTVSRPEGALLVMVALGLMVWLYRRSPVFLHAMPTEQLSAVPSWSRAMGFLILGLVVIVIGAELVVQGAKMVLRTFPISEVFLGMTVVALGESLEETARMVAPARRGRSDLAWGNVVGTVIILLAFNLGVIALIRPLAADPLVLHFHAPYLLGCTLLVAVALLWAKRLGRAMGALLVGLYLLYLAVNMRYITP